jgi:ribonucleoside-diphosphate reductase alpha chain
MKVIKRDGHAETLRLDKITNRIKKQTYGLDTDHVDALEVATKVVSGIYDGISTEQLDNLAAETAAALAYIHPDYSILAARIAITRLHKTTNKSFTDTLDQLYNYIDPKTGNNAGLISDETYAAVQAHAQTLNESIIHDRDLNFDYFGFKTLERSYLLKTHGQPAETPQQLYMRVAVGIWGTDIDNVLNTYDLLSNLRMTHATPTLFNAGTKRPQLSSCFLLTMQEDSIAGIYKTLSDVAAISQNAGGIGLSVSNIRATGSYIRGTNGTSNGIVPMLKVFNETARYVDQCFAGDTLIKTPAGYKAISEILAGDTVLTTSGERAVKSKSEFTKQTITVITAKGKIQVTPDHLFLAIRNGKTFNNLKELIQLRQIQPEWISACDLTANDLLLDK